MECLSYCLSDTINLSALNSFCRLSDTEFGSVKFPDVVKLHLKAYPKSSIYAFANGTIICWNVKRHQIKSFLRVVEPFCNQSIGIQVQDEFSYQIGDETTIEPHGHFDVDCLVLESENEDIKLSLSYGFSQSVKLQYFEMILESLITKYNPMIESLSIEGHMPISRKQIRQVIGEILGAKSKMNLISNFLYHPKFFWQHPSLEEKYIMLEKYLHIERRVNAINHRLDTLNEIFDMFNAYLENRHSHYLEIVIILLIAIEIIFGVLNFHF